MVTVRRRRKDCRRGILAAEVALVMPVLLLVTFGAIRYGWFFLKAQQITNAARYGARVAIRANATHQEVLDSMFLLLGPFGAKILESGDPVPATFKVNGATVGDLDSGTINVGDAITVTITVPAADVDILPIALFSFEPAGWNIGASVTMSKEGE